jgi:hypothetical protein
VLEQLPVLAQVEFDNPATEKRKTHPSHARPSGLCRIRVMGDNIGHNLWASGNCWYFDMAHIGL